MPTSEGYLVFEDPGDWERIETARGIRWRGKKKVDVFACWRQHDVWTGNFIGKKSPYFYEEGSEIKMDIPLTLDIEVTEVLIGTLKGGAEVLVERMTEASVAGRLAAEGALGGQEGEGEGRETGATTPTTRLGTLRPWN